MTDFVDTVPESTPVADIPTAEQLAAAGAAPVEVDVTAMLAQIQALQASVARMEAEKGIPADAIAKAIADLSAHVDARAMQYPNVDFSEVQSALSALPKVGADVTPHAMEFAKTVLHEFVDGFANHELGYVRQLATAAYKEVLKAVV